MACLRSLHQCCIHIQKLNRPYHCAYGWLLASLLYIPGFWCHASWYLTCSGESGTGHVFLLVLSVSLMIVISPVVRTRISFIYQQHCIILVVTVIKQNTMYLSSRPQHFSCLHVIRSKYFYDQSDLQQMHIHNTHKNSYMFWRPGGIFRELL